MADGAPRCVLDDKGCLDLRSILQSFNAPINEEQAWAVCFQTADCAKKELRDSSDMRSCYCFTDTSDIRILKDGSVHSSSVRQAKFGTTRPMTINEQEMVKSLGLVIFHALDYGLSEYEERSLSHPLELLIDRMTSDGSDEPSSDDHTDEGIVQDSGELDIDEDDRHKRGLTLLQVQEFCAVHLQCSTEAEHHYKAVCRALVAEALELSHFLEKISKGTKELSHCTTVEQTSNLDDLQLQDWARLWVQVIKELRNGVKLKKVNSGRHLHPLEYELTPYEMLLDDIRSRRYKLNKVMVNGDLPKRVKKDAHALILEFIRSRPPLVSVSKRKLRPAPPKQPSLYEKLMTSIRQQHKLKPTLAAPTRNSVETSRTTLEDDSTPQPTRRLIKADVSLRLSISFDDEDDDYPTTPTGDSTLSLPSYELSERDGSPAVLNRATRPQTLNGSGNRRHSITVCESPTLPHNGHAPSFSSKEDFWQCSHWKSLECLSLTLEEVVHIRSVLTKAELESLSVNRSMHDELEKGKLCFICKKTKFAFFGPWGNKCKLCEKVVCDKCSSKMRIPTEHFAKIPVYMLSPSSSPPATSTSEFSSLPFWRFSENFTSLEQNKSSDESAMSDSETVVTPTRPGKKQWKLRHVDSVHEDNSVRPRKRVPLLRSKTVQYKSDSASPLPRGPVAFVCCDCKALVRHVIESGRPAASSTERRNGKSRPVSYAAPFTMPPLEESHTPPAGSPS